MSLVMGDGGDECFTEGGWQMEAGAWERVLCDGMKEARELLGLRACICREEAGAGGSVQKPPSAASGSLKRALQTV